jgi:hypothetical protein
VAIDALRLDVGASTLAALDPTNRRGEPGFALGRAHRGRRYVAAPLPAVLGFACGGLGLHRLHADGAGKAERLTSHAASETTPALP